MSSDPLSPEDLDCRLDVARKVVRAAGSVAADYFVRRKNLTVERKGRQDLVSEADRHLEELIVEGLLASFSQDGILGEEGGARNPGTKAVWVIDPIDGTHNFLTGVQFWCVSLGLVVDGQAVLGVIYEPLADELFSARQGGGAYLNGKPIEVSGETEITRARMCVGFSYRRPVGEHVQVLEALLSAGCEYLRLGSGALGLAHTAAGRFDGYWERHINSWDAAGGLALVREAGGRTNDFFASGGLKHGNEILAATPALIKPLRLITSL